MVIWASEYNLLSTTPFWISLAGTLVVVSGLTFLYHVIFTWLLPPILYCFGGYRAAESSWRIKFVTKFSNTKGPAIIVFIIVLTSAYSCALFIWEAIQIQRLSDSGQTKEQVQDLFRMPFIIWSEFSVSLLSIAEYLFQFALAPNKIKFALNPIKVVQMVPVIPGILAPPMNFYYYGFQFLRFIQLYSALTFLKKLDGSFFVGLSAELVLLVGAMASIIFSTAGIIFILENLHFNEGAKFSNLFECVYFVVITFTTVGFGDYSPVSLLGKLFIIIGLFANFILLPTHVTSAIQRVKIWKNQRKYGGEGHVVVFSRGDFFVDFIHEFYSEALGAWRGRNMCLMTPQRISSDDRAALRVPSYKLRVTHMSGDMINLSDTKRTRAKKADACFILLSTLAHNHDQMDASNILRAVSLKKQNPKLKIYMQLFSSQYKYMLKGTCDNVVYSRDLRASILAQNAVAPGFTTLLGNLIVSQKPSDDVPGKGWLSEYKAGLHQTLHTAVNLDNFEGAAFYDVLYYLFVNEGALLIAVRSRIDNSHEVLDDTAIDITLTASDSSDIELSALGHKRPSKKKRGCCCCCGPEQEDKIDESAQYGPYRTGLAGHVKLRHGDQGVFIYRKKTKTLQKKIDRLRMTEFNSLVEGSAAWQSAGQGKEIHRSQSAALPLHTTKALTELLQDKFVEPASVAPEEHSPTAVPAMEDAPHEAETNNAPNTNAREEDFDPHCMLLGDRSLESLVGHVVVCVLDHKNDTHFDTLDSLDVEHSAHRMQLEQPHLKPSQLHAPDLIGLLKALRSRPALRETPIIFLMLRPPSPLQLQEFAPYRGLVYFIAGSPSDALDLQRAGATQARAVLILATDGPSSAMAAGEAGESNLIGHDANSLMIYRLLEYLPTYPVIQLVFPDNCRFLNQSSKSYFFNPHYVSGHIFIRSTLHYILAQAYYKEEFVQVVEKLTRANISHVRVSELHQFPMKLVTDESRKKKLKAQHDEFTYKELVKLLLARGQVPLALYRFRHDRSKRGSRSIFSGIKNILRAGHSSALVDSADTAVLPDHSAASFRKRFVFTNPDPDTPLYSDDIVFVLAR